MSAQGDKFRNRPDEDPSTRRTAEEELMRGGNRSEGNRGDRGVGESGGGSTGGSGTAGGGVENEGTGSLMVDDPNGDQREENEGATETADREGQGSGSTKGGSAPGVSGQRGMSGGTENEGEGHNGPTRSGSGGTGSERPPANEQERAAAPDRAVAPDRAAVSDGAADQDEEDNAREGYEDQGSSRDADGTRGESSGSRPGYR